MCLRLFPEFQILTLINKEENEHIHFKFEKEQYKYILMKIKGEIYYLGNRIIEEYHKSWFFEKKVNQKNHSLNYSRKMGESMKATKNKERK
jgi:hypothetical protein